MAQVLQLDPRDNVLIALTDLKEGDAVEFGGTQLFSDIARSRKTQIRDSRIYLWAPRSLCMACWWEKPLSRYAMASCLRFRIFIMKPRRTPGKQSQYQWTPPDVSRWKQRKFLGYRRGDGQVGTRNYWVVVPLVFCENRNILNLKQAFEEELGFAAPQALSAASCRTGQALSRRENRRSQGFRRAGAGGEPEPNKLFPNIDGVKFLLHEGGCGGTREDSTNLCGLIAGYINHPNVAGATVLSLGCQHAQVDILREQSRRRNPQLR